MYGHSLAYRSAFDRFGLPEDRFADETPRRGRCATPRRTYSAVIDGDVAETGDERDVYGVEAASGQLALSIQTSDTIIGTLAFGA